MIRNVLFKIVDQRSGIMFPYAWLITDIIFLPNAEFQ